MSVADELQKLQQLYDSGTINADEFAQAKAKILRGGSNLQFPGIGIDLADVDQQTKLWGMILHLSTFSGFQVPIVGLVAPIIIWQLKKDELPELDAHGKNAVNWMISYAIYFAICSILTLAIIGIPLLIALIVVGVVFPIVAAIKASKGEVWKYPMTITFL